MKLRNSFVTAGFTALALAGASVLGSAGSAQAFGLSFTPPGQSLADGDGIRDLVVPPGATAISFGLLFDSGNLDSTDVINEIVLNFGYDNMELPTMATAGGVISDTLSTPAPEASLISGPASAIYKKSLTFSNLGYIGGTGVKTLGTVFFTPNSSLPSDGKPDFFTLLTVVKGVTDRIENPTPNLNFIVSDVNNYPQLYKEVEVQSTRAVPTPALLPGLAAFGMSLVRKRKQEQAA